MRKVKVEKLPPGIAQGAIDNYVEKHVGRWEYPGTAVPITTKGIWKSRFGKGRKG